MGTLIWNCNESNDGNIIEHILKFSIWNSLISIFIYLDAWTSYYNLFVESDTFEYRITYDVRSFAQLRKADAIAQH